VARTAVPLRLHRPLGGPSASRTGRTRSEPHRLELTGHDRLYPRAPRPAAARRCAPGRSPAAGVRRDGERPRRSQVVTSRRPRASLLPRHPGRRYEKWWLAAIPRELVALRAADPLLGRPRHAPPAVGRGKLLGGRRSPAAVAVGMDGPRVIQQRPEDAPGLLDGVLVREQRRVAGQRRLEQDLVRRRPSPPWRANSRPRWIGSGPRASARCASRVSRSPVCGSSRSTSSFGPGRRRPVRKSSAGRGRRTNRSSVTVARRCLPART
jgi:hypothetical protein